MSRGKKPEQEKRNLVHVTRGNKQDKEARGKGRRRSDKVQGKASCKARKSKARRGVPAERISDHLDCEKQGNAMQSKARQGKGRVKATKGKSSQKILNPKG